MANASNDITFVIPGEWLTDADTGDTGDITGDASASTRGHVKASVRVVSARAGNAGGAPVRVSARPGEDVVELGIVNGPTLVLHPQDALELMQAQVGAGTRSASALGHPGEVLVAAQLGWPGLESGATRGATRGWMGQALLRSFKVLTGFDTGHAATQVAAKIAQHLDDGVDAGVYPLTTAALPPRLKGHVSKLDAVPPAADGGPLLVLVHGTFVDTVSTFGKLWSGHAPVVRDLFGRYANRVYALDHPTLGVSPIGNALTLVQALPAGARLHLLTHSRGGLVAEVLARACGGGAPSAADLAHFDAAKDKTHKTQRAELQALVTLAQAKGLAVERVVRVACPARGTTLASKRLDAYLSVLRWGLQLAGLPVASALVDFLHEVARSRAQPDELPGLEAMLPDSAIVNWLNSADEALPGELRVIAGDLQGDTVGAWVKTLLADAFYWTDNDLVVQTRSMYGGAPRSCATAPGSRGAADADADSDVDPQAGASASFMLDRGAAVTHFNYFSNERSVNAIAAALLDAAPADFAAIGPLSWAGEDASGTRAARAVARSRGAAGDATAAQRPAVIVLPGILGSHLKLDGQRIWLGLRFLNGLKKLGWDPASADRFEADGAVGGGYDDLLERLADSHEVSLFAYDWRRPIEDEARRLAGVVDEKLSARVNSGLPVRLLAHSMGGLVARTMQLEAPATWSRMMGRDGARLLMLGTPNGGSWSPMQTLSGDDTFGNALVAVGSLFDNSGARKLMAGMPGFIQLQAGLLDPALGLERAERWQQLADDDIAQLRELSVWHGEGPLRSIYAWGAPPQAVLDQAVKLRRGLDAQRDTLGADAQKMTLVIGRAPFTPAGYVFAQDGLEYRNAVDAGDGRVTLDSAVLPGVATWKVDAVHGKLPDVATALDAYIDLLTTGQTERLERHRPLDAGVRGGGGGGGGVGTSSAAADDSGGAVMVRSRPSRGPSGSQPPSRPDDVVGRGPASASERDRPAALDVVVFNGNLRFVRQPLLVGHYQSLTLTGAECVIDSLVGRSMSRAMAAGLYPSATGSHQIFGNQRHNPANPFEMARPMAAIVVGLGAEGALRLTGLVYSVRQAVLAYAQQLAERAAAEAQSAGAYVDSAGAEARGVARHRPGTSFDLAATLLGSGGPGISAGAAAYAIVQGTIAANLRLQGCGWPTVRTLTLVELYLERAADAWRTLRVQAANAPQRLQLVGKMQFGPGALRRPLDSSYRGSNFDFISALHVPGGNPLAPCIAYTLDSKRARTEVRAQHMQGRLLRALVAKASNDAHTDRQIGRTLFNLLIPVELEAVLGGSSEMVIELQPETAAIPWELLDTHPDTQSSDPRPWAIRSKLIRKLALKDFREQVRDACADDNVLVIGEPLCDPTLYGRLDGAQREARAVVKRLMAPGSGVAADQIKALVDRQDAQTIINALFERPYRVIHIAGHGEPSANGGVVLSDPHTYLGANEVNAMRTTPELVFLNCCHLASVDPADTLQPRTYDRAGFAANIAEALIKVGVRCVIAAGWAVEDGPAEEFATRFYASLLGGARFIDAVGEARVAAWNANRQGNTWAAYQCYGDPEWTWSRDAGDAPRQDAPLAEQFAAVASPVSLALALETLAIDSQFGDVKAEPQLKRLRYLEAEYGTLWGGMGAVAEAFGLAYAQVDALDKAIEWYSAAVDADDGSASFVAAEQQGRLRVREAAKRDDAPGVRAAIEELERLVAMQPTLERENLLGSAWRSLTMVETRAGRAQQARDALSAMTRHYQAAEELAQQGRCAQRFAPAKHRFSAELRAAFLQQTLPGLDATRLKRLGEAHQQDSLQTPDFWSVAGQIQLQMLAALAHGRLAGVDAALATALRELKTRVPAVGEWKSMHDHAEFVLVPYLDFAAPAEHCAAQSLLGLFKELAQK